MSLGRCAVAGAVEEAELRVQAILSIVVGAGGVSWQSTGSAATTLDGQVVTRIRGSNFGPRMNDDAFGVGQTYEILQLVAEDLGTAMAARPMPEYLIEALHALREASMTDHRDVSSYGARAVTPRIATALEDHALELIASGSSIKSDHLVNALEEREIDWQFEQQVLGGFLAPFDELPDLDDLTDRRALEQAITHHQYGTRVVLNAKVAELQHNLLNLSMSRLARAELTDALKIATDTAHEIVLHQQIQREVKMIRLRHRRVRNAINHGNPLTSAALESVRGFGERIAQAALDLALEGYVSDTSIETRLATEQMNRQDQLQQRAKGRTYFERERKE